MSDSLQPHELQHARPPCPSPTPSPPKPMSIESVMPSNHLILCRPLLLLPSIFPSIKVFSNESALRIRWPKYWSFSFNISPSNEHRGRISFKELVASPCSPQKESKKSINLDKQMIQFSHVQLFATPWTAARQAFLSITNSQSPSKPMSIESVMPTQPSPVVPFSSCLQSFLASRSFQMSQLFASGGQSTGVSTLVSVLPKKSQGWSPLGWTGWISLQSKGLSRVFSNTTVQKRW